jgi:hypothetical protein
VDFYQTNPVARASKVMAEASAVARGEARQDSSAATSQAAE